MCFCVVENISITKLDISRHDISNKEAKIIARALQDDDVSLQKFDISHNNISDDGAVAISECLKANTTLKELNISNNEITNDGIIKIAEAIKVNTTLSLLDASGNKMDRSTEVARALSDHLKHNNTLHILRISWKYSNITYVYHVRINNEC